MATLANEPLGAPARAGEELGFYPIMAIAMALIVVVGFSTQLAMGRSTFASPLRVHVHAVLFMGWVAIFVTQSILATRGPASLHRTLGWFSLAWIAAMVAAAMTVIVAMAQGGTVPFFFQPQHFLIADPLTLVGFVGLTLAAVKLRHRTDWHARLHVGAMATLTGPAFGRLLPMPLLAPYAFEAAGFGGALLIGIGMLRDRRRGQSVHKAWWISLATLVGTLAAAQVIAHSPVGDGIYRAVVDGYPGEQIGGLDFPPPPAGPLRTGK